MVGEKLLIPKAVFFIALDLILGFFAGFFIRALFTALFNIGVDGFGLTAVAALIPIIFFAFILYIESERRNHNFWSRYIKFSVGFVVGVLFISLLLSL